LFLQQTSKFWFIVGIFTPVELRGRLSYPDLSKHSFTPQEKIALLDQLNTEKHNGEPISMRQLCERYQINRRTVRNWKVKAENGDYLYPTGGRPPVVDEEGLEHIQSELTKRKAEKLPADESALVEIISSAVHSTGGRCNRLYDDPSITTVKRIKTELDLTLKVPQIITKARFEACSDVRMSYSVWIMVKALTQDMIPQLHWNWDATQFVVGQTGKSKKVYAVKVGDNKVDRDPLAW
jgi:transposase